MKRNRTQRNPPVLVKSSRASCRSEPLAEPRWRVVASEWIRPAAPTLPLLRPPQGEDEQDATECREYWSNVVARIVAGETTGREDFESLYRPAIHMILMDRYGVDRARTLLTPTVQRLLDRIATGKLTTVAEMAAEICRTEHQGLALASRQAS